LVPGSPGVDQGFFVMDRKEKNGEIKQIKGIDAEAFPTFTIYARAVDDKGQAVRIMINFLQKQTTWIFKLGFVGRTMLIDQMTAWKLFIRILNLDLQKISLLF